MSAEDVARKLGRLDLVPDSTNAGKEYLQARLEADTFPLPLTPVPLLEAGHAWLLPKPWNLFGAALLLKKKP